MMLNLHRLSPEDEGAIREHHATEGGYERCVICRLLATIDFERELEARPGYILVRAGSGGVLADGTTNRPAIDFATAPIHSSPESERADYLAAFGLDD